jgi:hypothetical protein
MSELRKPRIATLSYRFHYPDRVCVYNSDYAEDGDRISRLTAPWVAECELEWFKTFPTHAEAIAYASKKVAA